MKLIYIFLMLLFVPIASAETGIVLNETGYVQYKYDTTEPPTLQPGEYIIPYTDINTVMKGAHYDGVGFVNPTPVVTEYMEDIEVPVSALPVAVQTAISALAGAGAGLLVRKRTP